MVISLGFPHLEILTHKLRSSVVKSKMCFQDKEIIIGSRSSQLALTQTNEIVSQLKKLCPATQLTIKIIKTKGDRITDLPLSRIGRQGLFIKELEEALLKKEIDLAVHSMKDVPTDIPPGLIIGAITKRLDTRDVLISKGNRRLNELPKGAVIGTSSLRRKIQLLDYRQDFKLIDLRGNLDTRLKKLSIQHELQAIIVALAGVIRLGLEDKITQILPTDIILPAAGQGALGLEVREDDMEVRKIISQLNDEESYLTITSERAFLKKLGGGCHIPVAVLAQREDDILKIKGLLGSKQGKVIKVEIEGKKEEAEELGYRLALQSEFRNHEF